MAWQWGWWRKELQLETVRKFSPSSLVSGVYEKIWFVVQLGNIALPVSCDPGFSKRFPATESKNSLFYNVSGDTAIVLMNLSFSGETGGVNLVSLHTIGPQSGALVNRK